MIKKILSILIIITIFISCYLANSEKSSGTVSVKITSDIMKNPDPGYDYEVKIRFFPDGEMEVDQASSISYLTAYPETVTPGMISISVNEDSGSLTIQDIPADIPLNLLAEFYDEYEESGIYYIGHAGLSDSFEVEAGENTQVSLDLVYAEEGTLTVDFSDAPDYDLANYGFVARFFEPAALDSYITISGDEIDFDPYSFPEFDNYYPEFGSYPYNIEARFPGKKMVMLVSYQETAGYGDYIGISDVFEVLPGRTLSVPVQYYYFIGGGD